MVWLRNFGLLLAIPSMFGTTSAIRMPMQRRSSASAHSTSMVFNSSDPFNFGFVDQSGDGQSIYVATVIVDGTSFEVQLDTGSSDLWLDTTGVVFSGNVEDTHIEGSISYGDGTSASGIILLAPVQFGAFVIENQAFIHAPGTNATSDNDKGLLGIGPPAGSTINQALQGSRFNGQSLLKNIFSQYPNESNYMTFQFTRSGLGMTAGGVFSIAEVDPNYSSITNSPQLEVISQSNQWTTFMDGVIFNGQFYSGNGFSANATDSIQNKSELISLLDSGTSLSEFPQFYVDLIYSGISGSQFDAEGGGYTVPCDTKVNVSLVFSGIEYPMNPLDLITLGSSADNKSVICSSSLSYSDTKDTRQDFILGDAFLRNVYTLFDFGNFTDDTNDNPFMQLLSLTDKDQAWADFDSANQARIAQWTAVMLNNNSSALNSPGSPNNVAEQDKEASGAVASSGDFASSSDINALMRNSYIIMGLLAGIILVLIGVVVGLFVKRGASSGKGSYKTLNNPTVGFPVREKYDYETPYGS